MKRSQVPAVERLEGRALLSAGLRRARLPVAPPIVASESEGVKAVLATDHQRYHQGQAVVMTLTATNTSNHDVTMPLGPSADGFYVSRNGRTVWASNSGPQPLYLVLKTLRPGESFTLSATWDGRAHLGPASTPAGALVVHSQIAGAAPITIQIPPA
jgi:hypothetical protein